VPSFAPRQLASLLAGTLHRYRLGAWLLFGCSLLVLSVCLAGVAPSRSWENLSSGETGFLVFAGSCLILSIAVLSRHGRPAALFWTAWVADLAACSFLVYLAFFFQLQF
jgi:hypothetical protein